MKNVYIVGAKGLGQYGGYETFVKKLIEHSSGIQLHIACKLNGDGHMNIEKLSDCKYLDKDKFMYRDAVCYLISVPQIGSMQAVLYDAKAILNFIKIIRENHVDKPIVYVLACRLGPLFMWFVRKIHKEDGIVYINPDGHEWMRSKWSIPIKKYWKLSEKLMVKYADGIICDSKNIELYIKEEYNVNNTKYIAYGADIDANYCDDSEWLEANKLIRDNYYLVVGRFVPENNYEIIIKEFMKTTIKKDLAIITNVSKNFLEQLNIRTGYSKDKRIKFVGTVYDEKLLNGIRRDAYGYLHGHEVGGTNPSLLEALANTKLNLLLDVGFNREVADNVAMYWTKEDGNLQSLLEKCENMERDELGLNSKRRIAEYYSWEFITNEYIALFEHGL